MANKYDINHDKIDDSLKKNNSGKSIEDMESFIDNLDKVKELDEQNPLEQAIKFRAVKQNPPVPGYMKVDMYKGKDAKGRPIVKSVSEHDDGNGKIVKHEFDEDPFYTVDLNKAIMADVAACPSNVGPMLLDMAQKFVELKKGAFKQDKRRSEFSWWWIVLAVLLIPGILTVVFMMFGGG